MGVAVRSGWPRACRCAPISAPAVDWCSTAMRTRHSTFVGPGRPVRRQRGPRGPLRRASPEQPPPLGVGSMSQLPLSPARVRIGQLAGAIEIAHALWTRSPATHQGEHYSIENAYCIRQPNPMIPIHIGGMGKHATPKPGTFTRSRPRSSATSSTCCAATARRSAATSMTSS